MKSRQHETLILGLGNPLRGDDAVGLYLVEKLKERNILEVDFITLEERGLSLLDVISKYKKVIVVDAIFMEDKKIGEVVELEEGKINLYTVGSHYLGIEDVIEISRKIMNGLPEKVQLLGIVVEDFFQLRDGFTEKLFKKLPEIEENLVSKLLKIV